MANENKTFSLEEVKQLQAEAAKAAVAREKAQRENFIPKAEHEALQAELKAMKDTQAEAQVLPKVKEAYEKAGGNKEAFNDFYALNKDNIRLDNDSTLEKSISEIKEAKGYLFNEAPAQAEASQKEATNDKEVYAEGSLERIA